MWHWLLNIWLCKYEFYNFFWKKNNSKSKCSKILVFYFGIMSPHFAEIFNWPFFYHEQFQYLQLHWRCPNQFNTIRYQKVQNEEAKLPDSVDMSARNFSIFSKSAGSASSCFGTNWLLKWRWKRHWKYRILSQFFSKFFGICIFIFLIFFN